MTTTTVPSRTGGLPHTVTRWPAGRYSCTCKGYTYARHCWAIETVALMDELDRPQPARIGEAGRHLQELFDV